ncbi:Hypothetical protein, putative, partial [Bodo saltans]
TVLIIKVLIMFSVISPSAPVQLPADRVVLGVCITGGWPLWEGVLKTAGQLDQAVAVKRVHCNRAAAVARRVAALVNHNHHHQHVLVLGLVDVTPTESYVDV